MNQERIYQIIQRPRISEKTAGLADSARQITFDVINSATKPEIKTAVETLFKVEVDAVRTVKTKGKSKRFGRSLGKRKDVKKAYVKLKEGHDIDFIGMAG